MNATVFQALVVVGGSLATIGVGLTYFGRVRLSRPAIGAFNGRDVVAVFVLIVTLPLLYVVLPPVVLTGFLVLTFVSALSIGYRPLLPRTPLWLGIGALLGVNIAIARGGLGTVAGWQAYWLLTSVTVLLAASAVANLYVQGGMRLRHVAWFALALSAYDLVFTTVAPVTDALVEAFLGFPLNPSVGMRWGIDNAAIGIGDLLVYGLFVLAVAKGYGRRAGRLAVTVVLLFGAVAPALFPLMIDFVTARADTVVPAQVWFGPAAFVTWLWLRHRYGQERTMREFLAAGDDAPGPIGSRTGPGRRVRGSRSVDPSSSAPMSGAELAPEDLAGAGAGQRIDDPSDAGQRVVGDVRTAEVGELVRAETGARLDHRAGRHRRV